MSELVQALMNVTGVDFGPTWVKTFFNLELVRQLLDEVTDGDQALTLLAAGANWDGVGMTTSRATLKVVETTGVTLVKQNIAEYKNAFLFALSLLFEVDVPSLELSDAAAQAAFGFVRAVSAPAGRAPGAPTGPTEEPQEQETLEWDEPLVLLPGDLNVIWEGVLAGERKLELQTALQGVPRYTGLPQKAAENNHRQDGKAPLDRALRNYQQQLLHTLRFMTSAYIGGPQAKMHFQQGFQLLGELFLKLQNHRKEYSIPGSVQQAGQPLFGREELNQAALVGKVNAAGRSFKGGYGKGQWRFRPSGFRGGFRGFGGGATTRFGFRGGYKGTGSSFRGAKGAGDSSQTKAVYNYSFFLSQAPVEDAMVAETWNQGGSSVDSTWCDSRVEQGTLFTHNPYSQVGWSSAGSRRDSARLPTSGSSTGNSRRITDEDQVLGTLVPDQEAGAWLSQGAFNLRLQAGESKHPDSALPVKSMARHLPLFEKRHACREGRPQTRLLSPQSFRGLKTFSQVANRSKSLPIQCSTLWVKPVTPIMDGGHEDIPKTLAQKRSVSVHLFGRHSDFRGFCKANNVTHSDSLAGLGELWDGSKLQEEHLGTSPRSYPFGFHHKSKVWPSGGDFRKTEKCQEGTWKVGDPHILEHKENGFNPGLSQKFFGGNALSESFHR
jgi:hypothetical protein